MAVVGTCMRSLPQGPREIFPTSLPRVDNSRYSMEGCAIFLSVIIKGYYLGVYNNYGGIAEYSLLQCQNTVGVLPCILCR